MSQKTSFFKTPWSVMRRVRIDLKHWRKENQVTKTHSLSVLQRSMLHAGEHPLFCILAAVAIWLGLYKLNGHLSHAIFQFPGYHEKDEWPDSLTYFSALWTIQATIAALVYPIVIALTTILLQGRVAADSLTRIYLLTSGAIAAGVLSVGLVAWMGFQYVIFPRHSKEMLLIATELDSIWFVVNAILTLYFLYRTIAFFRDEVQIEAVEQYLSSIAFPSEIAYMYSHIVMKSALSKGWIRAADYGEESNRKGPSVFLGWMPLDGGNEQVQVSFGSVSRLSNVYFHPLRIAIALWQWRARKWEQPASTSRAYIQSPLLVLSSTFGMTYKKSLSLATVYAGPPLNVFERWLVRGAYSFRSVSTSEARISVKAVLAETTAKSRSAAGERDPEEFARAFKAYKRLHLLLLGLSRVTDENGQPRSWALMSDLNGFAERPLHLTWLDNYAQMAQEAVTNLRVNAAPFKSLAILTTLIRDAELGDSPIEIQEGILHFHPRLMQYLATWWASAIEEQGASYHAHDSMHLLDAPVRGIYESALRDFIGGWETAIFWVSRVEDTAKNINWEALPDAVRMSTLHAELTARMLLSAVSRGDVAALVWLADIMAKWWGRNKHLENQFGLYEERAFVTVAHLRRPWSEFVQEFDIVSGYPQLNQNPTGVQFGAYIAALKNYWMDIRLISLEICVAWVRQSSPACLDNSLAAHFIEGELNGKVWQSGGTPTTTLANFSATEYLTAKIRERTTVSSDHNSRYLSSLDAFVGKVRDSLREPMVDGRVYGGWGSDDVSSLALEQVMLMAVLSSLDWVLPKVIAKQIDRWASSSSSNMQALTWIVGVWLEQFILIDAVVTEQIRELITRTGRKHSAEEGLSRTSDGLKALKELLSNRQDDALANEPIEEDRVTQYAKYASSQAFDRKSGCFPLPLFGNHPNSGHAMKTETVARAALQKSDFTRSGQHSRPFNEGKSLAETFAKTLANRLFSHVYLQCNIRAVPATTPDQYWNAFKHETKRLEENGLTPILLLDNQTRPEWVWQLQHEMSFDNEYTRPEGLTVHRANNPIKGYLFDLNDVAVYEAPIRPGTSVVMAKETFKCLDFASIGEDDTMVKSRAKVQLANPLFVDLTFEISYSLEVAHKEIVILAYETITPDDSAAI